MFFQASRDKHKVSEEQKTQKITPVLPGNHGDELTGQRKIKINWFEII